MQSSVLMMLEFWADNTLFAATDNIEGVIRSSGDVDENFITWFFNNQIKLNPDKCHLLLNTKEQTTLKTHKKSHKKIPCEKNY